jgi:hypothetical protein
MGTCDAVRTHDASHVESDLTGHVLRGLLAVQRDHPQVRGEAVIEARLPGELSDRPLLGLACMGDGRVHPQQELHVDRGSEEADEAGQPADRNLGVPATQLDEGVEPVAVEHEDVG